MRVKTLEKAQEMAQEMTQATGVPHIGYKADSWMVDGKFTVEPLPQIGEEVSMGFNGDYYPCGEIIKISPTFQKIMTSSGIKFTRVAPNRWKRGGKKGAFCLVRGSHDRKNQEF